MYTCESHLKDPSFASRIEDKSLSKPELTLSADEVAQVKADWEERQKRKSDKAKEKGEEKGEGDGKDSGKSKDHKDKTATSSTLAPSPQQPPHERYALHRDIFKLRTTEHRKRKQAAQAKELAPRLPGAPNNPLR